MEAFLLLLKYYAILDVAFLITSLFTLHFPSWKLVKEWVNENTEEREYPSKGHRFAHTIAYSMVAFIAFPILMPMLLINNREAIAGYTKSIIKGMQEDEED